MGSAAPQLPGREWGGVTEEDGGAVSKARWTGERSAHTCGSPAVSLRRRRSCSPAPPRVRV